MKIGRRISVVAALAALLVGASPGPRPEDPVVVAARQGDMASLRALIAQGADVNQAQGDGMTALHWAAMRNDAEAASLLIKAGAALDAGTRLGAHTPLHVASQSGSTAVVRALLESGRAVVDARSTAGATPLHLASGAGHAEVAGMLLEKGADANAQENNWAQTPLVFAAAWNRDEVIRVLLRHGANPELATRLVSIPERARLAAAARRRGQAVMKERLANGPEGEPRKATLQDYWAAEDAVREVLRSGVIPADDKPPAPAEEPQEFDYIMEYNDQVGTMGGMTPLLHAVREGNVAAVDALLDGGANIEAATEGTTPLLMASINGQFDLAMHLLERGANANVHNSAGTTALYGAIDRVWAPKTRHPQLRDHEIQKTTHIQLLQALLERGADPNVRLERHLYYNTYFACMNALCGLEIVWGATPFWRAAYALDLDAMKLLVAHGADPNIPVRQPPMVPDRYWMTGQGMGALSRVVIEAGDPSGLPPVPVGGPAAYPIHAVAGVGYGGGFAANAHRHVVGGWMRAMKYLVEELGADVNIRDHLGYTPLHHAASRGDDEMVMYLIERGSDPTAVSRRGQTTADMANGPWERLAPFPSTIAILEKHGSKNNHMCVSC